MKIIPSLIVFIFPALIYASTPIEFNCIYPKFATNSGIEKTNNKFEMTFLFEAGSKKAYMKGNNGIAELLVVKSDNEGYSFIEVTSTGNVMTTAIDKNLVSVHSRNSIIFGKIISSQYYGECAKK